MRQMPPLAPCFYEVQLRICQFPLAPLVRSHPGIEWFYHCPLCICQVARVRLPHFIASFHVFILLLESAFVNMGSNSEGIHVWLSLSEVEMADQSVLQNL